MSKFRITQPTPYDRLGTLVLVFCCKNSRRNCDGVAPDEGAKYMWDGLKSANFDQSHKRCKIRK